MDFSSNVAQSLLQCKKISEHLHDSQVDIARSAVLKGWYALWVESLIGIATASIGNILH